MERRRKKARSGHSFLSACVWGIAWGILTGVCLVFALSAVAFGTTDPTAMLLPLGLIALAVSALITGRVSCAVWGHGSLIPALVTGGIFSVMICLIGLCFPGSTLTLWMRIAGCPGVFLLVLAGGALKPRRGARRRRTR